MVDPWMLLAFVAACTERVTLGTSVSQIALRPPVLMARELATLDRLSGGRVIVGAGAGWVEEEFTSTAVPFETRGGRLNEVIRVLRHLWTTPEEPWHGKFFEIPPVGIVKPADAGRAADLRRRRRTCGTTARCEVRRWLHRHQYASPASRRDPRQAAWSYGTSSGAPERSLSLRRPCPALRRCGTQSDGREYRAAGVDGLILTYEAPVPDAFLLGGCRQGAHRKRGTLISVRIETGMRSHMQLTEAQQMVYNDREALRRTRDQAPRARAAERRDLPDRGHAQVGRGRICSAARFPKSTAAAASTTSPTS